MSDTTFLFIMCGLPFGGKTTLARVIAEKYDIPRINLDLINAERGLGLNAEAIPSEEWQKTYEISYARTIKALEQQRFVTYDATNFTVDQRQKLIDIAENHQALPVIIYPDISKDQARNTLHQNRVSGNRYDVRDEDFNHVADNFQPSSPDEAPVIKYSRETSISEWVEKNIDTLINF